MLNDEISFNWSYQGSIVLIPPSGAMLSMQVINMKNKLIANEPLFEKLQHEE